MNYVILLAIIYLLITHWAEFDDLINTLGKGVITNLQVLQGVGNPYTLYQIRRY